MSNINNTDVNQYVQKMRDTSAQLGFSKTLDAGKEALLNELIEFYRLHPEKAKEIITSIEVQKAPFQSSIHHMHYDAAVIATRGRPQHSMPPQSRTTPPMQNRDSEMEKLMRQGWKPLKEETSEPRLLID